MINQAKNTRNNHQIKAVFDSIYQPTIVRGISCDERNRRRRRYLSFRHTVLLGVVSHTEFQLGSQRFLYFHIDCTINTCPASRIIAAPQLPVTLTSNYLFACPTPPACQHRPVAYPPAFIFGKYSRLRDEPNNATLPPCNQSVTCRKHHQSVTCSSHVTNPSHTCRKYHQSPLP